jgi:hypothetical protein
MSFELYLTRKNYTLTSTTGELFLNNEFFCYTLEDTVRGENIKIAKHTAIPCGIYKVKLSMSNRFQRLMPMIYTETNEYEIIKEGISFKGVRMHGGNTHENTEGCILVAKNLLNDDLIQGTMERPLVEKLEELGGEGIIIIVNEPMS